VGEKVRGGPEAVLEDEVSQVHAFHALHAFHASRGFGKPADFRYDL
jgi:hypothetical protein